MWLIFVLLFKALLEVVLGMTVKGCNINEGIRIATPLFCSGPQNSRRTPGGVSGEQNKGKHLPQPADHASSESKCSPGHDWLCGLQVHNASSCRALHSLVSPTPSSQACSWSIHYPVCPDTGDCPNVAHNTYVVLAGCVETLSKKIFSSQSQIYLFDEKKKVKIPITDTIF